jgi:heme iron utilization protein
MSEIDKVQSEYESFLQGFKSAIISTVSEDGIPNASYAPFVSDASKNIYIYVSGLASRTQNLQTNPHVGVLLIEDESHSHQIFARRRISFDCKAIPVERETEQWYKVVEQFQERFGQIIEVLRELADFQILQLTPYAGRFVIGFGAAYHISGDNLNQLVQITPRNK